ncbi:MAG: hypothetical protein U0R49_02980 [Fimbriimonadales bacterium]
MLSLVRKIWIYLAAGLCLLGPIALGILSLALYSSVALHRCGTVSAIHFRVFSTRLVRSGRKMDVEISAPGRGESRDGKSCRKLFAVVANAQYTAVSPGSKLGFTIGSVILMTQLGEYRSLPKTEREKSMDRVLKSAPGFATYPRAPAPGRSVALRPTVHPALRMPFYACCCCVVRVAPFIGRVRSSEFWALPPVWVRSQQTFMITARIASAMRDNICVWIGESKVLRIGCFGLLLLPFLLAGLFFQSWCGMQKTPRAIKQLCFMSGK